MFSKTIYTCSTGKPVDLFIKSGMFINWSWLFQPTNDSCGDLRDLRQLRQRSPVGHKGATRTALGPLAKCSESTLLKASQWRQQLKKAQQPLTDHSNWSFTINWSNRSNSNHLRSIDGSCSQIAVAFMAVLWLFTPTTSQYGSMKYCSWLLLPIIKHINQPLSTYEPLLCTPLAES